MEFKVDCRYYVGDKPCAYNRLCEGCLHYSPMGTKILVIKLGAIGDVLRTTPLLRALHDLHQPCHITWVADEPSCELLSYCPLVDRIVSFGSPEMARFRYERFDICLSLDKDTAASVLAMEALSDEKMGFGFSRSGNLFPLNQEAEYAVALGMSDKLKFIENKKTYQEVVFEACRLSFGREEYVLELPEEELIRAKERLVGWGVHPDRPVVGCFTGAGDIFANKEWTIDGYCGLISRLNEETDAVCMLLGGPQERDRNSEIMRKLEAQAIDSGCDNTLVEFASLVDCCDVVVTGDTLAMHLAIARSKEAVVLFGPTCPQEIDLYGRGEKIISPIECAPCYLNTCDLEIHCQMLISVDDVFEAVRRRLDAARPTKRTAQAKQSKRVR